MGKSIYIINSENGKRPLGEIIKDLVEANTIVFQGGNRNRSIARQVRLVEKMHLHMWYRPKPGCLDQCF